MYTVYKSMLWEWRLSRCLPVLVAKVSSLSLFCTLKSVVPLNEHSVGGRKVDRQRVIELLKVGRITPNRSSCRSCRLSRTGLKGFFALSSGGTSFGSRIAALELKTRFSSGCNFVYKCLLQPRP